MEKNERENLVQNVIDFICFCELEDFSQITQKGLADKFNTSPEHLSRAFKRETDQTFQEFLIGVKMNRSFNPHFSPAIYCNGKSTHVCCVALPHPPRRTVKYASGGFGRAPFSHGHLCHFVTIPGEKCGLTCSGKTPT